jgi:hypothetical protein
MDRRGHRHLGDDGNSSEVSHAMVERRPQGAASLKVMQVPSSLDGASFEALQKKTGLISRSHDPFSAGNAESAETMGFETRSTSRSPRARATPKGG